MPSAPQFEPRSKRRAIRAFIFSAALIASAATLASTLIAPRANAQDLGEIARQERAKKQNNPAPSPTHVYTNDDLKREEILTPEDKSRFTATNQPAPVKPAQPTTQSPAQSTPTPSAPPTQQAAPQPAAQTTVPTAPSANAKIIPAPTAQSAPQPKISVAPTTAPVLTTPVTPRVEAPAPAPVPEVAAPPVAATIPAAAAVTIAAPTTVPLDQLPLGDVARYYRTCSTANPGCAPSSASSPTPSVATTVPTSVPAPIVTAEPTAAELAQMPLGDVARYYRAKKLQDDAITITLSVSAAAPSKVAQAQSTSRYPLTVAATPLASMKSPPARGAPVGKTVSRRSASGSNISASPVSGLRTGNSHPSPIVPIRRAKYPSPQPTSVRVARGDTLWQLARRYLGSGTRWTELLALNPTLQDPRRLQVGAQLVLHPTA